ncbi:YhcN/YlaJ family sporulation lipoprotein [Thermodesulfitimonas autotrophica]|uniref:YhcN/YlaJ family sporulation lipoprotein n=1 Tax=Thermodesulfitimonas autotrophica TaxID=1894989 RepID=A0A3N5BBB9_9THEO|nr:YhcN/YlaJ family sporulation lipoprotein [Thermodesulfitimonas autotrophica]RPF42995.1 YhcN/YlaJ family sporulation lipoprotein [Thermodesulfitimonas autotrophica]
MHLRRFYLAIVTLLVLTALFCGGCSPARKPTPSPATPTRPVTPAPARKPLPTDPREMSRLASRLASEAARVPGVNKATVVLAGSTAYVGLDLKAGLEKGAVDRVKRDVAARLKRAEPRLTRVMVTTDPDTYTRIRRVQEGIAKGKPLSAFTSELREINRRMTPETR